MVIQLITNRPIIYLCLAGGIRTGPRVSKRWWEQDRVGVEGMQKADREAERRGGENDMDRTETETD